MVSRQIIKQLSYLALIANCLNLQANINNLKGTFDVLKDEYKQFSIINGAIADQTGYIMHLYDYGTLGQMRKITMPDQSAVLVPDISNAPEAVKLVHLFFHRTPGAIGPGDFVLTQELRDTPAEEKREIIQALAWIIAQAKELENKLASKGEGAKQKRSGAQQIIKALTTLKAKEGKWDSFSFKEETENFHYLATVDSQLTPEIIEQKSDAFILFKMIWQSMQQEEGSIAQISSGIKPFFQRLTTVAVLSAIVYKLAGNDKILIKDFYERLNTTFASIRGETIFIDDSIPENWITEHFNPADKQILAEPLTFNAYNSEELKQYYETIVYLSLLPGDYPRQAGYTTANYNYDPNDAAKNVHLPDCMDNIYRNIFNNLLYNKDTLSFDIINISAFHPISALINFYTRNKDASDTESLALHNQWTQVIENIPLVTYNRKVGVATTAHDIKKKGYIKVPDGADLGADYIPVGNSDVVYEIEPSARNIIIVFNHLLGLDLFANETGNTSGEKAIQAFMRQDFVKTYFPLMCEKIGISFKGFYLSNETRIDETIDKKDYDLAVPSIIIIKLKINKNAPDTDIVLQMRWGHGEMITIDKITTINPILNWFDQNFQILLDPAKQFFNSYFVSLAYLAGYKENDKINDIFYNLDPMHAFNLLFYLPIQDIDYVSGLIRKLSASKKQLNEFTINLLSYLGNSIPDEIHKHWVALHIYQIIICQSRWKPKGGLPGVKNSSAEYLIQAAAEATKSSDQYVQLAGLNLFKALVEKKQGYPEATQAAAEALISTDYYNIRPAGLGLFKTLFEKGQGYPEASQIATKVSKSTGLDLFKALFEKGQGYPEASQAAAEEYKSSDYDIRQHGLELFKALFEKGQGFTEAIKVASDALKSTDYKVRQHGLDLFDALFEKGQGFTEAIKVASNAMKSSDYKIQQSVMPLFNSLFEKKQGYQEAIKAASDALKSSDYKVQQHGLDLFDALFEKGQAYSEATKAASEAMKSANSQNQSLRLFITLVAKGQAYPEASQAAAEALKSTKHYIQHPGMILFSLLFEKNQGYPEAIRAAFKAIKSQDPSIKTAAAKLIWYILEKFEKIPLEFLTPEFRETIKDAIEVSKSADVSTPEGKEILQMAQELEKKIQQK